LRLDKSYVKSGTALLDISFRCKTKTTQNHFRTYTAMAQWRRFQFASFGLGLRWL